MVCPKIVRARWRQRALTIFELLKEHAWVNVLTDFPDGRFLEKINREKGSRLNKRGDLGSKLYEGSGFYPLFSFFNHKF